MQSPAYTQDPVIESSSKKKKKKARPGTREDVTIDEMPPAIIIKLSEERWAVAEANF